MRTFLYAVLLLSSAGAAGAQERFGWAGQDAANAARKQLAQELPPLTVEAKASWQGKALNLWWFTKHLNQGNHLANVPQEIGDCVSFGNGHSCEYSQATAICVGSRAKFVRVFKPYIYGCSRVQIGGGRLSGDGSTGAWAAAALQRYGVLAEDAPNCPKYSGSVARKWGARPGPPAEFLELGKKHLADARLVRDWDSLCESISNGWPVAICSSAGFSMREADGRLYGTWNRTWPHCMDLVAYDDRPGSEAAYCLNSWGPNAHAGRSYYERTGEPPGGFWIRKDDVRRILNQGDSYAISFNGFKRNDLFGKIQERKVEHENDQSRLDALELFGFTGISMRGRTDVCPSESHDVFSGSSRYVCRLEYLAN